jgi:ribose transport system permease protein
VLFALYVNTVQPDNQGNFYELYGIAAAVLGGCSLRGGEGSVLGVIVGAALMRVLTNAVGVLGLKNQWEFAIIGIVILAAVIVDEVLRRARKASA